MGTNVIHVDSLTQFSFRYKSFFAARGEGITQTYAWISGLIVNQVRGLEHAYWTTRMCASCILHVACFNEELGDYGDGGTGTGCGVGGGGDNEKEVQREEVGWFLSCIMEGMRRSTN